MIPFNFNFETPEYARNYSMKIVKIEINRTAYYEFYNNGGILTADGIYLPTEARGGEYIIYNQQLKIYILRIIKTP